jgi:hypothetical protein
MTSLLNSLIPALALLAIAFVVVTVLKQRKTAKRDDGELRDAPHPWPFESKPPLSHIEQVLYFRLAKALPECIVLAQVPLSSFLSVKSGNNFQAWNNRINRMSVDYLVCLKDATIVAAIELDDRMHERPDSIKRDNKKNNVLRDANVNLIRWRASALPSEEEIRAAFVQ